MSKKKTKKIKFSPLVDFAFNQLEKRLFDDSGETAVFLDFKSPPDELSDPMPEKKWNRIWDEWEKEFDSYLKSLTDKQLVNILIGQVIKGKNIEAKLREAIEPISDMNIVCSSRKYIYR